MKINGLEIDVDSIAAGIYDIICDKGEEAIVAFGMIPKWVHDAVDGKLREKVIALSAEQNHVPVEEFRRHVDADKLNETVKPILKAVCSAIYGVAKRRGMMAV